MTFRVFGLCLLLCVVAVPVLASGDDAPGWLQQAAGLKIPPYEKDVLAVSLVDEATITVADDGRVTNVHNFAVRILRREGRAYAKASVGYIPESGKVKEFHAWLMRDNGATKGYGKDDILDLADDPNDVYNEYRLKVISGKDDADAGTVFGYSYTTEERSVFSQRQWIFQQSIPVMNSRYTLVLPNGWRAESITFNHPNIEPVVNASSYTWELKNLPPIPNEPLSPSLSNLVARLAVSYYPPTGRNISFKTFANWNEVGVWMGELEDPQVVVDDALTNKVRELTSNAKSEYEKIKVIGRYVQSVRYISIQRDIARGGGYRPHSSTEVFAKSYGDCKDKANLMRAMLRVVGIEAFPVSIYSGDPEYVRANFPSPGQFNHCIIAIKVSAETQAATVIQAAKFGRLLIFDPTDTETPVGDLPIYLQGSLALIDSKDSEALVTMPTTPPESNSIDRQIEATLGADGTLTAKVRDSALGASASGYRSEFRHESKPSYLRLIEGWISTGATAAKVSNVEPNDNSAEGRFDLNVDFSASEYGQLMQNRLLVFKPAIVSRRDWLVLTEAKRKHPVVLRSNAFTETVRMKLPVGFEVDELPDAVKLDTAFGSYKTTYEVKNGELVFTRALAQKATTIPSDQYQSVRSFYEKIRAAEQAPVVLARKQ